MVVEQDAKEAGPATLQEGWAGLRHLLSWCVAEEIKPIVSELHVPLAVCMAFFRAEMAPPSMHFIPQVCLGVGRVVPWYITRFSP